MQTHKQLKRSSVNWPGEESLHFRGLRPIGMVECWNIGKMGLGILQDWENGKIRLAIKFKMDNIL
jgi:hypothetical protein